MTRRDLRVAGVQMRCRVGDRAGNLARAAGFAEQAARDGAELICFPELMSSGYTLSPELWRSAEASDGPTVQWLRRTSAALGVHLGTSFVELDGGHVHNTFVLTGPQGDEVGRVRKTHAETYFFRGARGPHVIDSPLGRIGVGICADNLYADVARLLARSAIDLLLMPYAGPAAHVVGGLVSPADVRRQHELLAGMAPRYATMLGVPAVFVNQCGPTAGGRGTGILGSVMNSDTFHFPGLSTIAEAGGEVVARLGADEGVVLADVTADPARAPRELLALRGTYVTPGWNWQRRALFGLDGAFGRVYYAARRHTVSVDAGGRPGRGRR